MDIENEFFDYGIENGFNDIELSQRMLKLIVGFIEEDRKKQLILNGVGRSTKKNNTKHSVKCLHCGRSFIKKLPHKCNTGYRKRNHKWQELADD